MALFSTTTEEKKEKTEKSVAVKESSSKKTLTKRESPLATRILSRPRITEKSYALNAFNQYVFVITEDATKKSVKRAIEEPLRHIAKNAGLEGSVIVEKVRAAKDGFGLNALTGEIVDMVKAGIVDPAKVTRSTIQNAASIAALVLTTETLVVDKPEAKKGGGMPGGGMDDMGGMGGY